MLRRREPACLRKVALASLASAGGRVLEAEEHVEALLLRVEGARQDRLYLVAPSNPEDLAVDINQPVTKNDLGPFGAFLETKL